MCSIHKTVTGHPVTQGREIWCLLELVMRSSCHAQLVCSSRAGNGGHLPWGCAGGLQTQHPHAISAAKGRSPHMGQLSHSHLSSKPCEVPSLYRLVTPAATYPPGCQLCVQVGFPATVQPLLQGELWNWQVHRSSPVCSSERVCWQALVPGAQRENKHSCPPLVEGKVTQ